MHKRIAFFASLTFGLLLAMIAFSFRSAEGMLWMAYKINGVTAGSLLGVFPDEHYEEIEIELRANDRLLFYSDGFEQAFEENGVARHIEAFGALSGVLDADELVQRIASGVDRHTGSLHQRDDLTLLCVGVELSATLRAAA